MTSAFRVATASQQLQEQIERRLEAGIHLERDFDGVPVAGVHAELDEVLESGLMQRTRFDVIDGFNERLDVVRRGGEARVEPRLNFFRRRGEDVAEARTAARSLERAAAGDVAAGRALFRVAFLFGHSYPLVTGFIARPCPAQPSRCRSVFDSR